MHGDLRAKFEREIINMPASDERDLEMGLMNILCGNVEMQCAYAAFHHWQTVKDGRNIFDELGKSNFTTPVNHKF